MKERAICQCKLTMSNVARWDIPDTPKHRTIRKDSFGREWCQSCTDDFDSIDWDEVVRD